MGADYAGSRSDRDAGEMAISTAFGPEVFLNFSVATFEFQ